MAALASYLARHGCNVSLITLDTVDNDRYQLDPEVVRVGLRSMGTRRSVFHGIASNRHRISQLRRAVREAQPEVAISFCDKMNILSLLACRSLGIPVVISERSDPQRQRLGWSWEVLRRWTYPTCSRCVVQTASVGKYLEKIVGNDSKMRIIPSAIEPFTPARMIPRVAKLHFADCCIWVGYRQRKGRIDCCRSGRG